MSYESERPPDRLDQALAELPPGAASPGFTRRVLAALDAADRRETAHHGSGGARRWALAAAAVLAVAVGIFLGARPEPPRLAAERESLRLEHDELMRELETLRSLANETRPFLYLGSSDDVDYVLDLSPLLERSATTARPAGLDDAAEELPRYY